MSLLKIINTKVPLDIISKTETEGFCNNTTTVKFSIPSSNLIEMITFVAETGGDEGNSGSFDLSLEGGQSVVSSDGNLETQTVPVPTNTPLVLKITAHAPTYRVWDNGVHYIISTSCEQSAEHPVTVVGSMHVTMQSDSLGLNARFDAIEKLYANNPIMDSL